MKKHVLNHLLFVLLILLFFGCVDRNQDILLDEKQLALQSFNVPNDFSYSTKKDITVILTVPDFLKNAVVTLHMYNGFGDSLQSKEFAKVSFDENGYFESVFSVMGCIDTILVKSGYLGLMNEVLVPIVGASAEFDYRPDYEIEEKAGLTENESNYFLKSITKGDFTYIGEFDSHGTPKYLVSRDIIQQNLLDDLNQSLPEYKRITDSHPEYLAKDSETNIILTKDAQVWVTFVAEGANWENALGYYTYEAGDEPQRVEDIEELKIIFPNASQNDVVRPGDKVYLGQFDANTVIGWFLVADGWNGNGVRINSKGIHFSQPSLNSEKNPDQRQHMVLLYDKAREKFFMGFEDMSRDGDADEDFNDLVFYTTVNPVDAVQKSDMNAIDAANDSDGDGINDELDDFPFDPDLAFNNFSPSAQSTGSLAFEDLWPSLGDYDFNDLVVGYNFNLIANGKNHISKIVATFIIEHIGASYKNGFAFEMPITTNLIESIENQVLNRGYVELQPNGTESGVSNSVIFVVEDATPLKGDTIQIVINLKTPVNKNQLGSVPFNPFIVVNGDRSREVHLPDMPPTSKGTKYLGQKDDYSNPSKNRYYKSNRNLPWGINIYGSYSIPPEKKPIFEHYPRFKSWANSGGVNDQDWFLRP